MSEDENPAYRKVDGVLVRIPGDMRDTNRRYRHVIKVKESKSYDVEFTDEEERRRDDEEAQWIADAPKREAQKKKQDEERELQ